MIEILGALAAWRLARMITNTSEEGPFGVFSKLRNRTAQQATWFERGVWCLLCVSVWTGLAVSILLGGELGLILVRGLAFSAASIALHRFFG